MDKLYHESILLLSSEKRTFLNRNYYGARDVFFGCFGVSKGQGNDTEIIKTDMNNIYLINHSMPITEKIGLDGMPYKI